MKKIKDTVDNCMISGTKWATVSHKLVIITHVSDLIVIKVEEHGFISDMIYPAKVLNHDFSSMERFFVKITLHTKNC